MGAVESKIGTDSCVVLKDELQTAIKLCGLTDVGELGPELLNTKLLDPLVVSGGLQVADGRVKARL